MFAHIRPYASLLALTLFSFIVFSPALFFGKAFFGEEQAGFYYVISYYVAESLQTGLPLSWIPYYFGGVPASLDQFVSGWYPLNRLLFSTFDFFTAHHLSMTVATALGLIFSYWFGRLNGWLKSTSFCLALLYFSATTYAWLLIGTTAAHSFAILPGLLVALQYAYTKHRYVLPVLAGGLALGIGFLAGFVQIVFYDFVVAGFYALFLDWTRFERNSPFSNLTISYTYAAITCVGLIVGFLQIYPSASLIESTIRTSTYAIQNAATPNVTEFLTFVMPPYFEIPFFDGGGSAGFYLTAFGFIGALLALLYYRTSTVFAFATIYALMAAFAFHIFPFSWINEHVPPFSRMGGNFRWMVGAAFPLAFLAAAGIEGMLRSPERLSRKVQGWILTLCVLTGILLALGGLAVSLVGTFVSTPERLQRLIEWYTNGRTLSFPSEHYVQVLSQTIEKVSATFSFANPRFMFAILMWPLAAGVFALVFRNHRYRTHLVAGIVLLGSMGPVVLQWQELVPQSLYRETPEIVRIIREREDDSHQYRILGYLLGDGSFLQIFSRFTPSMHDLTRVQIHTLTNNTNVFFDIERMDGMEPYRTLRHNRLLNTVIGYDSAAWAFDDTNPALQSSPLDQLYNRDAQKLVTMEEKLADFKKRIPLLSMMNVKYVYSPYELSHAALKPITHIPIATGTTTPLILHVYENTSVLPRVYMAENVSFALSERESLLGVISTPDFSRTTWIECGVCTYESGDGTVDILKYTQGYVEVEVKSESTGWLVLSESYFPGWHATIDNIETTIYTANYLFQAVRVPAGSHQVRFFYEDVAVSAVQNILR